MEFSVWCLMTSKETDVLPPLKGHFETLLSSCCSNKSWIDSEFRTEHSLQTGNLDIIFKRCECLQHVKQLSAVPQPTNKMSGEKAATNKKAEGASSTNRWSGLAPDYEEEEILLAHTNLHQIRRKLSVPVFPVE